MRVLFVFFITTWLSACATEMSSNRYQIAQLLLDATPTTSIGCRFEKKVNNDDHTQTGTWYFWRQKYRTETRDDFTRQGEIWTLNPKGQYFFTRLFFQQRLALDFSPGDLAATNRTPEWRQLSSLIDPQWLGKELTLIKQEHINGTLTEYYRGNVTGVDIEVDWLPQLQLPSRLVKNLPEGPLTLTLLDCAKAEKFPIEATSKPELDRLRHIDYTDLGDMEEDPAVQRIQQLMGHNHHAQ